MHPKLPKALMLCNGNAQIRQLSKSSQAAVTVVSLPEFQKPPQKAQAVTCISKTHQVLLHEQVCIGTWSDARQPSCAAQ
jgi:hypothetical protein